MSELPVQGISETIKAVADVVSSVTEEVGGAAGKAAEAVGTVAETAGEAATEASSAAVETGAPALEGALAKASALDGSAEPLPDLVEAPAGVPAEPSPVESALVNPTQADTPGQAIEPGSGVNAEHSTPIDHEAGEAALPASTHDKAASLDGTFGPETTGLPTETETPAGNSDRADGSTPALKKIGLVAAAVIAAAVPSGEGSAAKVTPDISPTQAVAMTGERRREVDEQLAENPPTDKGKIATGPPFPPESTEPEHLALPPSGDTSENPPEGAEAAATAPPFTPQSTDVVQADLLKASESPGWRSLT
ncbi:MULTISPECIES: hypothetical protein [Pseudofrankia]|uniref:hypothetical protein n=1 Tax=Pseudofrankia TaxID=2994363 RepID=UPI000234B1B8|nr:MULTISPECIES: hypothetical protein [Pseudofrankia]OHV32806.1 hypothetical protein BCD49_28630 [Pseudofrankia sp. EUN1h]